MRRSSSRSARSAATSACSCSWPPLGLAAAARTRRLTLPLAWLLASVVGVAAGGVFHPRYWMQVAAPLVLLAGLGIDLVAERWAPAAWALGGAALLVPLAYSLPAYTARTADRVSELTSADHRYVVADEVADAVAAITDPDERVAVLWTNAAIHWYADRASAFRHMWFEPLENLPGAAATARGVITGPDPPAAVVVATRPGLAGSRRRRGRGAGDPVPARGRRGRQSHLPVASRLARAALRPVVLCPC